MRVCVCVFLYYIILYKIINKVIKTNRAGVYIIMVHNLTFGSRDLILAVKYYVKQFTHGLSFFSNLFFLFFGKSTKYY